MEDALNQMVDYCCNTNNRDSYCIIPRLILTDDMLNRMFINIFNSEPKFTANDVCFVYKI